MATASAMSATRSESPGRLSSGKALHAQSVSAGGKLDAGAAMADSRSAQRIVVASAGHVNAEESHAEAVTARSSWQQFKPFAQKNQMFVSSCVMTSVIHRHHICQRCRPSKGSDLQSKKGTGREQVQDVNNEAHK